MYVFTHTQSKANRAKCQRTSNRALYSAFYQRTQAYIPLTSIYCPVKFLTFYKEISIQNSTSVPRLCNNSSSLFCFCDSFMHAYIHTAQVSLDFAIIYHHSALIIHHYSTFALHAYIQNMHAYIHTVGLLIHYNIHTYMHTYTHTYIQSDY
jgi:hypothetical protein